MRTLESTFTEIVGRPPSPQEKAGLDRLCGSWKVRGNQSLIALALVLHFGDPEFREFPAKYAAALRGKVRRKYQALAASQRIERGIHSAPSVEEFCRVLLTATAGFVALGVLGLFGGISLEWRGPEQLPAHLLARTDAGAVFVAFLTLPGGWILLGALAIPAFYSAVWGCSLGMDAYAKSIERGWGWAIPAAVLSAVTGWITLMLWF